MSVLHLPRPRTEQQEAVLRVASLYTRVWPGWDQILILSCAVFHCAIGFTLAFAPYQQIYNAGTAPVYDLASRYVWAGLFTVAGVATVVLSRRRTTLTQLVAWFTVLPLGGLWWTAFVLAVINGRGSAIGVVVWLVLYGLWGITAARLALGKR